MDKERIMVAGIGGMGNNFINRSLSLKERGLEILAIHTDRNVLNLCRAEEKCLIGEWTTDGQGAKEFPELGAGAATESRKQIMEKLEGVDILFLVCGLGAGTGSGAAPVIGKIARDMKTFTIALAVEPFPFESAKRNHNAKNAKERLKQSVDVLFPVPNGKLLEFVDRRTTIPDAFRTMDKFLYRIICGLVDWMDTDKDDHVSLDEVRGYFKDTGEAYAGFGKAEGPSRMLAATQKTVLNPFLDMSINRASRVFLFLFGRMPEGPWGVQNVVKFVNGLTEKAELVYHVDEQKDADEEAEALVIVVCDSE